MFQEGDSFGWLAFALAFAFQTYPASMLVPKPRYSCFEPVAKYYCEKTSAAAAVVDNTAPLVGPLPFAASAVANHHASSEVLVLGEVALSAMACWDDEEVAAEESAFLGPLVRPQFRKVQRNAYLNHDAKNHALNRDDVEIDLGNGYDCDVVCIRN